MLSVLFDKPDLGLDYAAMADSAYKGLTGAFLLSYLHCYRALAHLAVLPSSAPKQQNSGLTQVAIDLAKLKQFAIHAPINFQHQVELIEAERHRVLGQRLEAMDAYDRAITLAKAHGYIKEEAFANELAAKCYLEWGKDKVAAGYMQDAYYIYSRWGAQAKVADLEIRYPELLRPILQSSTASGDVLTTLMTVAAPTTLAKVSTHRNTSTTSFSQALDFASVLKASQALSSIIHLDELLRQLTQIVLQNSGGDRCILCLPDNTGQWQVKALTTAEVTQLYTAPLASSPDLPVKLIQYVKNTQEAVVIDDLETDLPVIDGPLEERQPKSVMCLPILNQGHLVGVVYLENKLTSGVFTEERILVLNFLCAQAAISLENARLYRKAQHYAEQLAQSQLQVVQNEKMATLGNLVAGVAHEVNNPIGFLNGSITNAKDYLKDLFEYLETYQSQQPPNAVVKEIGDEIDLDFLQADLPKLLDSMKAATDRIKGISTSLRTFSRADTENKVSANIHEGLNSTLLILKYRLKANENRPAIEIIQNYEAVLAIDCFPGQLNQVFMNILANAIDMFDEMAQHTTFAALEKAAQKLTIKTENLTEQQAIAIRISDNGKGMSDEVRSRIFDPLFTTKEVGQGTGLGLAIARKIIVETHRGSLSVVSEIGQGTEFCIQLPR